MPDQLTIYIAGPITNGGLIPISNAVERFKAACLEVAQLGHVPISPLEIVQEVTLGEDRWRAVMRIDIATLVNCDGIYLLRGWENSRGARLEKLIADGLDLLVLYQPEATKEDGSGERNR